MDQFYAKKQLDYSFCFSILCKNVNAIKPPYIDAESEIRSNQEFKINAKHALYEYVTAARINSRHPLIAETRRFRFSYKKSLGYYDWEANLRW